MRLRSNNIAGTLTASLTDAGTTLSGAELANLPALTAGDDYYPVTIDVAGTAPEIAYITSHTASATSAGMVRGKEGSTNIAHASGLRFLVGPTSLDFMSKGIDTWLDFPKHTAHALDDEFDGGADGITMDAKWTQVTVSGTPVEGTIDPYVQEDSSRWEVYDGSLWVSQWGQSNEIQFRQDATIADGECLVMKVASPVDAPDALGTDTATHGLELTLNDTDTEARAGVEITLVLYVSTNDSGRITFQYNGGLQTAMDASGWLPGHPMYLRIDRYGDKFFGSHSHDGRAWISHDDYITETGANNTWLKFDTGGTLTVVKNTVNRVDWIRVGSTNINPW